jgi:hypothetical protein
MAVTATCNPNQSAVQLDLTAKQQLRYTIKEDPGVLFQLQDSTNATLLSNDTPPRTRLWPAGQDQVPPDQRVTHPLGMQFGETSELQWRIELLDANGAVLQVVKDCHYRNAGAADDHFDSLTIFLKRGP